MKIKKIDHILSLFFASTILFVIFKKFNRRVLFVEKRPVCYKIYGEVKIYVAHDIENIFASKYSDAIASLTCYAQRKNYQLIVVNPFKDPLTQRHCSHIKSLLFAKHCSAAVYLNATDWLYVLDADTGVINYDHCLEDYIDPRYDVLHYERFHNAEIAAGNYIVRNTRFARHYLTRWARLDAETTVEFQNGDNGALHYHILHYLPPNELFANVSECRAMFPLVASWQDYNAFFVCIKTLLNGSRTFDKIKILRRGLGFVRDSWVTQHYFSDFDFMLHAMKPPDNVHFAKKIDTSVCATSDWTLPVKPHLKVDMQTMADLIRAADAQSLASRGAFLLNVADVSDCWPKCPDNITYKIRA